MKVLVVIDMQNDFIDGSLGTPEAQAIVPKVVDKIMNFNGMVFATQDTHYRHSYRNTEEGKTLPVEHCIVDTYGWEIQKDVKHALESKNARCCMKNAFGMWALPSTVDLNTTGHGIIDEIEIIGLCTDICVISNALLVKAYFFDKPICVDAACCAGTTPEMHEKALDVMRSCHIHIR